MNLEIDEETFIKEEAAEMMETFLVKSKKPPRKAQWQDEYKERTMALLWRCNVSGHKPPVDLVMLVGCLFGKRHDWSVTKFAVINQLAKKYKPIKIGDPAPEGLKSFASKIIMEYGGTLNSARELDSKKGTMSRDYRRTIDKWLKEPLFLYLWEDKYYETLGRSRKYSAEILESIKTLTKKSTSA